MTAETDATSRLIQEARTGSVEAMDRLIGSVRTYLLLIANKQIEPRLRQKVAASDVVQDACLLAASQFPAFRGSSAGEFRAWLRHLLLNSIGDFRKRYLQSQKRAASREVAMDEGLGVPTQVISPRTSLITQEESTKLNQAMCSLPTDHQTALRMRNWNLMSFADIGRELGCSANAAQKLWTRAVKLLEQELKLE